MASGRVYGKHYLTEERKKLAEDNLPLVFWYIKEHVRGKLRGKNELEEIDAFLRFRLCLAAGTYDPEKGKFSTYAGLHLKHGYMEYKRLRRFLFNRYVVVDLNGLKEMELENINFRRTHQYRATKGYSKNKIEWEDIKHLFDLIFLKPQEKQVVFFYHEQKYGPAEIGKIMGCSRERIRQVYKGVINKLKKKIEKQQIKFDDVVCI